MDDASNTAYLYASFVFICSFRRDREQHRPSATCKQSKLSSKVKQTLVTQFDRGMPARELIERVFAEELRQAPQASTRTSNDSSKDNDNNHRFSLEDAEAALEFLAAALCVQDTESEQEAKQCTMQRAQTLTRRLQVSGRTVSSSYCRCFTRTQWVDDD